jgi:hypothetical protein
MHRYNINPLDMIEFHKKLKKINIFFNYYEQILNVCSPDIVSQHLFFLIFYSRFNIYLIYIFQILIFIVGLLNLTK